MSKSLGRSSTGPLGRNAEVAMRLASKVSCQTFHGTVRHTTQYCGTCEGGSLKTQTSCSGQDTSKEKHSRANAQSEPGSRVMVEHTRWSQVNFWGGSLQNQHRTTTATVPGCRLNYPGVHPLPRLKRAQAMHEHPKPVSALAFRTRGPVRRFTSATGASN
ncbi:hypothetical protein LIA77_03417 [Sarocladium implicatum]|nr:hypothetical protein LIA77_03417 [Sarocladium implicatum]